MPATDRSYLRLSAICLAIWAVSSGMPLVAAPKLSLSQFPKVYRGPGNIRVTFVPVTSGKKQALIEVVGSATPLDGKVFLYDEKHQGRVDAYVMQYDGSEAIRLQVEPGYWSKSVVLSLPEHKDDLSLTFDEKLSRRARVIRIAQRYETDKALQAKLAKFDRPRRQEQMEKEVAEVVTGFSKDCGTATKVVIDWKSFSDDHLRKATSASFCGRSIERLAAHCTTSTERRDEFARRVETIKCTQGSGSSISLTGKEIDLMVGPETPIQDDSVTEFIRTHGL